VSASASLERTGWLALPRAVDARRCALLAGAIEALVERGLPPLFVYAFDEVWQIGEAACAAISRVTGAEYELLADVWAFRVAPGPEHRGWSAHRGSYALSTDRRAPDLVNVWIALTDATPDNGCMHLVELDDDPAYPGDLRAAPAPEAEAEARARAVPAAAGTMLAWNANVLHWGGRSSAKASGPRTSVTFTLARVGAGAAAGTPRVDLARLDHRARLDLLADQVVLYGELERTLPDVVKRWAALGVALRKMLGVPGPTGPRKAP